MGVYWVVSGVRNGVIISRGYPVRRDKQPISFWLLVVVYLAASPVMFFVGRNIRPRVVDWLRTGFHNPNLRYLRLVTPVRAEELKQTAQDGFVPSQHMRTNFN